MKTIKQNRLTVLVKRIIGVIWYLNILSFIVWPIFVLVVGLNIPTAVAERHTDLELLLGVHVYPAEMVESTKPSISGAGVFHLDNTLGYAAWYYAAAVPSFMSLFVLFGLYQLRKIFASLANGKVFTEEIPGRLKKFGCILIAWSIFTPFLQYFVGASVLKDIQFEMQDIELFATFEFNPVFLISGLAIIVLSRVLQEAKAMHDEQALTI
jgi:hypothetical protein